MSELPQNDERIFGVDVWGGYGKIDFLKVASEGWRFAIVRSGEAASPDKMLATYVKGATDAGLSTGIYYVTHPHRVDPKKEAEFLFRQLGDAEKTIGGGLPFPVALDCEVPPVYAAGTTRKTGVTYLLDKGVPERVASNLVALIDLVFKGTGRMPIFYTYPYWIIPLLQKVPSLAATLSQCMLWQAQYSKGLVQWLPSAKDFPKAPKPWGKATIWQYAGNGSAAIPGYQNTKYGCDRNVVPDLETYKKLIGGC